MTRSFLVQIDDDDMEYHAQFDAQKLAEALLTGILAARRPELAAKEQRLGVMGITVNYLGAN